MVYTIADMKLGDRLTFGRYSVDPNADPTPITWLKASDEGVFIAEFCVEYSQYDAAENVINDSPHSSEYYRGSTSWHLSNLRQFLNSAEEGWYTPSHPFDAPPIRREFGTVSIQNHRGFLENFEPFELEVIVKNTDGDYIRLPTMDEIIHERLPLFKRKGVRTVASSDLYSNFRKRWYDMVDHNYMAYWTSTVRDGGYMTIINRAAHTEAFFPSSHCGVRPVFRIRTDAPVDNNGATYFLKASASSPDLITTRIFEFLGI